MTKAGKLTQDLKVKPFKRRAGKDILHQVLMIFRHGHAHEKPLQSELPGVFFKGGQVETCSVVCIFSPQDMGILKHFFNPGDLVIRDLEFFRNGFRQ